MQCFQHAELENSRAERFNTFKLRSTHITHIQNVSDSWRTGRNPTGTLKHMLPLLVWRHKMICITTTEKVKVNGNNWREFWDLDHEAGSTHQNYLHVISFHKSSFWSFWLTRSTSSSAPERLIFLGPASVTFVPTPPSGTCFCFMLHPC